MTVNIEEIKRLVALQLGIKKIRDDDHFVEDLGAESVDVVNIVVAAEEKFQIEIKESEIPHILSPKTLLNLVKERV